MLIDWASDWPATLNLPPYFHHFRVLHQWPIAAVSLAVCSIAQQMEPALPLIFGQRSEHSLATGPVIPDPFISPLGLTITPALSMKEKWLERVNSTKPRLTLKVDKMTFSSTDSLALTDNDSLQHLLSQLWLSLLNRSKEHVSDWSSWETVESGTDTSASKHVKVLSSSVVGAVHDRSHWQRVWNLQLDSVASSSS